jgi:putative ABC transport system permease protein
MGANTITVQAMGTPLKAELSQKDVNDLSEIDNIKGVSSSISGRTSIVYQGNLIEDVTVQGKNQVYFANTEDAFASGRGINVLDVESKNRVCLIGQTIADDLFATETPIDKEIIVNGIRYTIIGTLPSASGFSMSSGSNTIMIPYTTAMDAIGTGYVNSIEIYMENPDIANDTTIEIKSALNTAFNDDENGYSIINMQNILDTVSSMTGMMSALLAGVASIALVVGGIGIMNMMLVSVTERTTEIGLRKALGARPKVIRWQFIIEALFLSIFGGILGMIAGFGIAYVACLLIGTGFSVASYSVVLGFGFSAVIGLIFGYMPAKRASELNPIDALRSV